MTPTQLKTLRATLSLTQLQLANRLGVVVSTIAKWEQAIGDSFRAFLAANGYEGEAYLLPCGEALRIHGTHG